jgi:Lon protease-like protein
VDAAPKNVASMSFPAFSNVRQELPDLVPVFPLPNVVLFPHLGLPLHIFEPRYKQMVSDALESHRLIAMALLAPGWQSHSGDKPPLYDTVCVGRITSEERLENGRFNLILHGLTRAAVVEEVESDEPYRLLRLDAFVDSYAPEPLFPRDARRRELLREFRAHFPGHEGDSVFHQLEDADLPLGVLCDILTSASLLSPATRQELLAELDVDLRGDLLLARLKAARTASQTMAGREFPPPFSQN